MLAAALLTLTTSVATLSHHPSWTVPKAPAACVTDGRNFIGCVSAAHPNNVMSAINPANGSTEWQVPNQQPGAASGVTLRFCTTRPSDAFLGSSAGQWSETVSAVDKMTGAVGWSFATAPSTVQCSLRGDIVYLPTSAVLFALDATTGASRWSQPVNDADGYHVVEVADSRDNSTTTSLIFVDTVGAHRLDGRTGEVLSFALSMDVGDIPIGVVGRVVLFQKANTSVVATTADGHAVWWWLVGFVPVQSFVQLHGDVLMFGETNDNVVEAINATTGKRLWTRPVDMNNAPTLAAVNDELLILSVAGPMLQNNTLYSYASWEAVSLATGELRWALHNVTTGCVYSFATANYFGVTNNAGDAIVAFKVADGTNRTLPIGNACTTDGPSLAVMETDNLLVVQNASIAIAYSRW